MVHASAVRRAAPRRDRQRVRVWSGRAAGCFLEEEEEDVVVIACRVGGHTTHARTGELYI